MCAPMAFVRLGAGKCTQVFLFFVARSGVVRTQKLGTPVVEPRAINGPLVLIKPEVGILSGTLAYTFPFSFWFSLIHYYNNNEEL